MTDADKRALEQLPEDGHWRAPWRLLGIKRPRYRLNRLVDHGVVERISSGGEFLYRRKVDDGNS